MELTEARSKLQDAINESHPMPSANYLRQAAAACLRYGLRSAESGLQLTPVLCAQVSKHIYCPDENDIMKRLQRSTCIKFLQFPGCPDHFLLDLQAIILPRVLSHVKDFVASIRVSGKRMHPEHHQAPQPPDQIVAHRSTVPTLPAQVSPLHCSLSNGTKSPLLPAVHSTLATPDQVITGSLDDSEIGTMNIHEVRSQVKAAISKSHPPSSKYLVETAAACLDNGLQTAPEGIILKPVAWNLVTKAVKSNCPALANLVDQLCSSVGQKYFGLVGTSPSGRPELVAAKLHSLITAPHHAAAAHLLSFIHYTQGSTQPDQLSTASTQATQARQSSLPNAEFRAKHVLKEAIKAAHLAVAWMNDKPSPSFAGHIAGLSAKNEQPSIPAAAHHVPQHPMEAPKASYAPPRLNKPPPIAQSHPTGSTLPGNAGKIWGMSAVAVLCTYDLCTTADMAQASCLSSVHVRSAEGCCTFDMKQQPRDLQLQGFHTLLENRNVVKILHDCRQAAVALMYQKSIRICNVFDTQVAQGVVDHINSVLGTSQHLSRRSFSDLVCLYGANTSSAEIDPGRQGVAQDSAALLASAKELSKLLGTAGLAVVQKLSQAYCQWNYLAADRSNPQSSHFDRAHAGLPLNKDLQMTFAEENAHKPSFSAFSCQGDDDSTGDLSLTSEAEADNCRSMQCILHLLPETVRTAVEEHLQSRDVPAIKLLEIIAGKNKPVLLRFSDDSVQQLPVYMDIVEAVDKLREAAGCGDVSGDPFDADHRMILTGTLHRISAISGGDQQRSIKGLIYRIGWRTPGIADLILDILAELHSACTGKQDAATPCSSSSLLLLGPPGTGKTMLLCDVVSKMANTFRKRVVVVDTRNEICQDGTASQACFGMVHYIPVPDCTKQCEVMWQAMQTYDPQVMVIDEIGSSEDVQAVRTIAQHGVTMIAAAQEASLRSLIDNSNLNALVGRTHQRVLIDKHDKKDSEMRTERQGAPLFKFLVQLLAFDQ